MDGTLGVDKLGSIYIASKIASKLDSYNLILVIMEKSSRSEIILNPGFKVRPLYCIKFNT